MADNNIKKRRAKEEKQITQGITLPIYNTEGSKIDTIKLNNSVFDGKINTAALHQAITAYRNNQRKGLASTKTRKQVSGGGKKPWRQKGTGRARVGSIRSPLWRHGGVIFGPHPKDFHYSIPKAIKSLALKSTLNAKIKENNLIILDAIRIENPKTKEVAKILANLKINYSGTKKSLNVLLLIDKLDNDLKIASANLESLNVNLADNTNAYEVLSHQKLVITKEGLDKLTGRLKK